MRTTFPRKKVCIKLGAVHTERNRVWQTDFSEFETTNGGIWRISAVIDYATKYCLAITVTPTSRGIDAVRCVQLAIEEAQRILELDDLRADRGLMDVLDAEDTVIGQTPAPIAIVTDNGPCYRGKDFQALFTDQDDPLLRHVRTRIKSPQTNGVIERFFGTLKYEHLYRGYIGDGDALNRPRFSAAAIRVDALGRGRCSGRARTRLG